LHIREFILPCIILKIINMIGQKKESLLEHCQHTHDARA